MDFLCMFAIHSCQNNGWHNGAYFAHLLICILRKVINVSNHVTEHLLQHTTMRWQKQQSQYHLLKRHVSTILTIRESYHYRHRQLTEVQHWIHLCTST